MNRAGNALRTEGDDKTHAVTEPGKFANYICPPARGINNQPVDFEYVRFS